MPVSVIVPSLAIFQYSMSPPLFPTALSASFTASAAEASSIESALIAVSAKTAILLEPLYRLKGINCALYEEGCALYRH